jgi:effector-binding domain-containing protein
VQKLLIATAAFIALVIVIGLSLPRYSRIEVSASIDANPATVFALINDFERASLWSPVTNADPNARIVYAGPSRGIGAIMTWDGVVAGSGAQTITESRPFEHVAIVTNPDEPGETRSWFDIARGAGGSTVTWRYESDAGYNIVGRFLALMVNDIFRRDFERALEKLKEIAEGLPRADFSDIEIEHLVIEATDIAFLSTTSIPEPAAISEAMGDAYFEILNFIDKHGLAEAGAPLSITRGYSGSNLLFDAAIPVRSASGEMPADSSKVKIGKTYSGPVIRVKHVGGYRDLGGTHLKIASYLAASGIARKGSAWESYVSDPTRVAEEDLVTYVFYPIEP